MFVCRIQVGAVIRAPTKVGAPTAVVVAVVMVVVVVAAAVAVAAAVLRPAAVAWLLLRVASSASAVSLSPLTPCSGRGSSRPLLWPSRKCTF